MLIRGRDLFKGGAYLKIGREAKEHDYNAIGVYLVMKQLVMLAGHVPIELSRLLKNFIEANAENRLTAQVSGKRKKRSWACCAGKVHGLHHRTTHSKNSGERT